MLDGIQNKIDPGEPLDKDIYDLAPEELAKVPKAPGSLDEALDDLEKDHEFLLHGDVFTEDVINTGSGTSARRKSTRSALRPHPYEFYCTSIFNVEPTSIRTQQARWDHRLLCS